MIKVQVDKWIETKRPIATQCLIIHTAKEFWAACSRNPRKPRRGEEPLKQRHSPPPPRRYKLFKLSQTNKMPGAVRSRQPPASGRETLPYSGGRSRVFYLCVRRSLFPLLKWGKVKFESTVQKLGSDISIAFFLQFTVSSRPWVQDGDRRKKSRGKNIPIIYALPPEKNVRWTVVSGTTRCLSENCPSRAAL